MDLACVHCVLLFSLGVKRVQRLLWYANVYTWERGLRPFYFLSSVSQDFDLNTLLADLEEYNPKEVIKPRAPTSRHSMLDYSSPERSDLQVSARSSAVSGSSVGQVSQNSFLFVWVRFICDLPPLVNICRWCLQPTPCPTPSTSFKEDIVHIILSLPSCKDIVRILRLPCLILGRTQLPMVEVNESCMGTLEGTSGSTHKMF